MAISSVEAIVQQQLDAYNERNVEAWLATYAPTAEQFTLYGERFAFGHDEMRARILVRFSEPDLHAELLQRIVMANIVVDYERITRNFPEGKGTLEMMCIYEVVNGLIQKASFAIGVQKLGC